MTPTTPPPVPADPDMRERREAELWTAMAGTTDGDHLDPSEEGIPIGEAYRLAVEYLNDRGWSDAAPAPARDGWADLRRKVKTYQPEHGGTIYVNISDVSSLLVNYDDAMARLRAAVAARDGNVEMTPTGYGVIRVPDRKPLTGFEEIARAMAIYDRLNDRGALIDIIAQFFGPTDFPEDVAYAIVKYLRGTA